MSTKNCENCKNIQATLDIANIPQANDAQFAYKLRRFPPTAIETFKKIRKILA